MRTKIRAFVVWSVLLVPVVLLASSASQKEDEAAAIDIEFTDVRSQTLEFMEYYQTIELTPEQERVKLAALSKLPAACCADNSAYTCCCVCNLSRTVWGLTAHLIVERDYSVEQIQTAVKQWIEFVNPAGFSGNACYRGGCARSFANNGCGGMNPNHVVW